MFRFTINRFLYSKAVPETVFKFKPRHFSLFVFPMLAYCNYRYKCYTNSLTIKEEYANNIANNIQTATVSKVQKFIGILQKIISYIVHTIRFFHLLLIFMPPILLLPLKMFQFTKNYWLDSFVKSIQSAGVVWIKSMQYLSHRRDMIGPQMAQKVVHLRQNAPTHLFIQTEKYFKEKYGKKISDIFEQFDTEPIASGSVSQVYKATYRGKKVAVKVRHPSADKYIERDINLLFAFSRFFSLFSKSFQIPVTQHSLKKTLIDQIDFNKQKDNLLIFNKFFQGRKDIKFPIPLIQQTNDAVLVENFIEGVPITYFENNKHPLNAVMVQIGTSAFFQMLMKHNFIHADCHGGNIIVHIKQKSTNLFSEFWGDIKQIYYKAQQIIIQGTFTSQLLRKLYADSCNHQAKIRKIIRECKQKVQVTLIDAGMVIKLQESDLQNFVGFIRSAIEGNGDKCAQMIYSLSNYNGKKLGGTFENYLFDLKKLFDPINGKDLDNFQGVQLFTDMLDLIRTYQMKLQGQFATLLTNMLILQAMAKDIDPDIKILKCAIPYFSHIEKYCD